MKKYFIAFEPDERLEKSILLQKESVLNAVGNQKYLSHPPHFTVIVFTSDEEEELCKIFLDEASKIKKFKINISGLHIFYDDVLTGGNSVVYNLDDKDIKFLKNLQNNLVQAIDSVNSKELFLNEKEKFDKLSKIERENVLKWGFPYVGDIWMPHITIASINKTKFEEAIKIIRNNEFSGPFFIDSICLYNFGDEMKLVKRIKLK